jgi:hypothetical protein
MEKERRDANPTPRAQDRTSDARRQRIAEAAYYNAERRGFEPGRELDDWLRAEKSYDGAEENVSALLSKPADGRAAGEKSQSGIAGATSAGPAGQLSGTKPAALLERKKESKGRLTLKKRSGAEKQQPKEA